VLSYCVPFDQSYQATFQSTYSGLGSFNGTMKGTPQNAITDIIKDLVTTRAVVLGFGLGVAAVSQRPHAQGGGRRTTL
jgi:hypothetical protein